MTEREQLRRIGRAARRSLSPAARAEAAASVAGLVAGHPRLRAADHVGLYRATPEELDPAAIGDEVRARGGTTWYPEVDGDALTFRAWDGRAPLGRGRFGIEVPPPGPAREASTLAVVAVPLVAFDRRGGRLGMGAGFYDRTFAFRREGPGGPMLVGLAFTEQEVDRIATAPWDVTLDAVVTPEGWIDCGR